MSKRLRDGDSESRPPKRPRPEQTPVEEISWARQVQQLLTFTQDIQQFRNGLASFKAFLESILYHKDEDSRARQISILREYLETQQPAAGQEIESLFLGQLWQAWSYATQNNNDNLVSQVSAILALLLRVLSRLLDLRDFGISLCRTTLQGQHLRLVRRGLDAPKHKDFVISPCLRLLTEVTGFGGGALAGQVYKRREQTFDVGTIRRLLSMAKTNVGEEDAKRRPAVRTLAVRYVLAHLKYLHEGGKADILKSRPLCAALFHHLADDPADLVSEILAVTEQSVLKDQHVPRSAKGTLLIAHNLERVTEVATRSGEEHAASERASAWLKAVATTPSYGILRRSGWYPAGTTKREESDSAATDGIDLGLDSIPFYDRSERPDLRNPILLEWLQTLRPHSDIKERELALACFEAAPELVAAYFAEKNMQLDPKLSNTWIGYASLLFEIIRLPVPAWLGNVEDEGFAELPPQTSIVLDSVVPRSLSQKVLTRCMNSSSELISFFAVRILVLALQKLQDVLSQVGKAESLVAEDRQALWREAAERLLDRISTRAPPIKDVAATFRRIPDDADHALQREAIARLLRLYHEVLPVQALEAQFDVSGALTAALARKDEGGREREIRTLQDLQLEHLLVIAQHSTSVRWFSKQGGLQYSPFVSLLRTHEQDISNRAIRNLLEKVLSACDLVAVSTSAGPLGNQPTSETDTLIASLAGIQESADDVWNFLDDCLARAARQPVKYVDQLEGYGDGAVASIGTLPAVVVEQAPFNLDKPSVMGWIDRYLSLLTYAAAAQDLVSAMQREVRKLPAWSAGGVTQRSAQEALERVRMVPLTPPEAESATAEAAPSLPFQPPPPESENHPELFRWSKKDLGLALDDGDIGALILCLCSQHSDIRRQALAQLRNLFVKLQASTVEDKMELAVLIGELCETFEKQCLTEDRPLPYLTGTFAAKALSVLMEPTHFMYPKVNKYLIKDPEWKIRKMPVYWFANTALAQPVEDDAYLKEVSWVVEWFVDGLRTPFDFEILRRGDALAKVLAFYASPGARRVKGLRRSVLEVVYRATCVEGGSDVLVSRMGVLAWLDLVGGEMAGLMRSRVLETCLKDRLQRWTGGAVLDTH